MYERITNLLAEIRNYTNNHLLYTSFRSNPILKRFDFVRKLAFELMMPQIQARLSIPTLHLKLTKTVEEVIGINNEHRVPPAQPKNLPVLNLKTNEKHSKPAIRS